MFCSNGGNIDSRALISRTAVHDGVFEVCANFKGNRSGRRRRMTSSDARPTTFARVRRFALTRRRSSLRTRSAPSPFLPSPPLLRFLGVGGWISASASAAGDTRASGRNMGRCEVDSYRQLAYIAVRRRRCLRISPVAAAWRRRGRRCIAPSGVDSEVGDGRLDSAESPPPRAISTSREAARVTCCEFPSKSAGCEARLCAGTGFAANRLRGVRRICKKGEPKRTID
jgi:hypothetical protein